METVISILGVIFLAVMFLAVPVWKLLHLCYMAARKCWRHEKYVDLSAFSTGELYLGNGSCTRQCIFSNDCNRHRIEPGPTRHEINKLIQTLKDYESKSMD